MKYIVSILLTCYLASPVLTENACCSFPCQNRGVCLTKGHNDYVCDCSNLEFYGKNCEIPTFFKSIKIWLKPDQETLHHILTHYEWLWDILNASSYINGRLMRFVYTSRNAMVDSPALYTSDHEYLTLDSAFNTSYYARILPPVPRGCPTPMGVAGKLKLPDIELLTQELFARKEFIPDPLGSNGLFAYYAQHFTHQFFKTDVKRGAAFQWGQHNVDVSHVYGPNKGVENSLRSMKDGKMKTQVLNGEEYLPYLKDTPGVPMTYFPKTSEESKFAIGHEFYGLLPGLLMYATIWVREHNRVCGVLKVEHPDWDDERLFQTAKLIILGETIKITIEDYVQHLSAYNVDLRFKPEVLFGVPYQYQNRISLEFNHLYHWHPLVPDDFTINGTTYSLGQQMFHGELLVKYGMKTFVESLDKTRAGSVGLQNNNVHTLDVVRHTLKQGRDLRFQSFNEYRKRFNLKPHTDFEQMTGEKRFSKFLKDQYGDIDAVEFYVGIMAEKKRNKAMFGGTIVEMGAPASVKGLMSSPICSEKYWRPSTFGGDVGFQIVNTANLQKLFCENIQSDVCPRSSFKVPDFEQQSEQQRAEL